MSDPFARDFLIGSVAAWIGWALALVLYTLLT